MATKTHTTVAMVAAADTAALAGKTQIAFERQAKWNSAARGEIVALREQVAALTLALEA